MYWVYPRVCGGTASEDGGRGDVLGLSPRVRGNRVARRRRADVLGSIPACAGEPARMLRMCRSCRVYPRVCGGTYQPPRVVRPM